VTDYCPWCGWSVKDRDVKITAMCRVWHKDHYYEWQAKGCPLVPKNGVISKDHAGRVLSEEQWKCRKRLVENFKPEYYIDGEDE